MTVFSTRILDIITKYGIKGKKTEPQPSNLTPLNYYALTLLLYQWYQMIFK